MKCTQLLYLVVFLSGLTAGQTPIELEPVKQLKPTGNLRTCGYKPLPPERLFFEKLAEKERATGSFMESNDIRKKNSDFVGWYGIVRGISRVPNSDSWELLLEHKYFDGLTDCHIMMVSISGNGDFGARLEAKDVPVPALALVRVYGVVTQRGTGSPLIQAEFVRVWPWMTFTFTDLGAEDKTNRRWKKECKVCEGGRVYGPFPDRQYYRKALGDPDQYGVFLKP